MTDYSKCCNDTVRVGGEGETHYYICNQCDEPCDVKGEAMTNLRNVVAQWIYSLSEDCSKDKSQIYADSLLALLAQHGVVQLDENQELPELPDRWHEHESEGWAELISEGSAKAVIDTLIRANFKRVRPLVEEK